MFFHAHKGRRPQVIGARLDSIKAAAPLTEDRGVIVTSRLQALVLVEQLRVRAADIRLGHLARWVR